MTTHIWSNTWKYLAGHTTTRLGFLALSVIASHNGCLINLKPLPLSLNRATWSQTKVWYSDNVRCSTTTTRHFCGSSDIFLVTVENFNISVIERRGKMHRRGNQGEADTYICRVSQSKKKYPKKEPMKILMIMYPLKYIASNMTKYATANLVACKMARKNCCHIFGRNEFLLKLSRSVRRRLKRVLVALSPEFPS